LLHPFVKAWVARSPVPRMLYPPSKTSSSPTFPASNTPSPRLTGSASSSEGGLCRLLRFH
jgi:hypothetical protein